MPPAGAGSLGPPPGGPPAQPRPGWLLQSGGVATPAVQGGCAVNTQDSPGTRSSVFGPLPVLLRFLIRAPSFRKDPPPPAKVSPTFGPLSSLAGFPPPSPLAYYRAPWFPPP